MDQSLNSMFHRLRTAWPIFAGLIMAGGVIGLLLAALLPVDYQATASLGIGIDYGRTQVLDANAERQALLQVQYLLLSDQVLEATLEQVGQVAEVDTVPELRSRVRLDRYESRWDLTVKSSQPQIASQLADAWANASVVALDQATAAAVEAQAWQAALYPVGCELVSIGADELRYWRCVLLEDELAPAQVPAELLSQVRASHGVIPGLTYAYLQSAAPAARPQSLSRVWLALAGSLIGLSVGLLAAAFGVWPFADAGRVNSESPGGKPGKP